MILRCLAKNPEARFPSASAMTAALALALSVPVPKEVAQSIYSLEETINQPQAEPLIGNDLPTIRASGNAAQAPFAAVSPSSPDTIPPAPLKAVPSASPTPAPPAAKPPSASRWRGNPLFITLIALLIIALIGAGLGAFFVFNHGTAGTTTSQFVGQAYFLSSGQADLTRQNSPGISDEVAINIQNMPPPATGKSYYAWLGKDAEGQFIPLGQLPFNNG